MATITIDTSHDGCEFDGHPDGEATTGTIARHRQARSACHGAILAEGGNDETGYTCTECGQPTAKVMSDWRARWTCKCGTVRSQVIAAAVDEVA